MMKPFDHRRSSHFLPQTMTKHTPYWEAYKTPAGTPSFTTSTANHSPMILSGNPCCSRTYCFNSSRHVPVDQIKKKKETRLNGEEVDDSEEGLKTSLTDLRI